MIYNLSKDYSRLYELLCEGEEVVCYLPGKTKDVCWLKRLEPRIFEIRNRVIDYWDPQWQYMTYTESEMFQSECKILNLEWIDPEPKESEEPK